MSTIDTDEQRRWVEAVRAVVAEATAWAERQGWSVATQTTTLTEDRLGAYEVPVLTVESTQGRIVLEPIARWASPGEGRIDVYSWPSLNRLMLVRKGGRWLLLTEAGVEWPQPWSQATFTDLAARLNAAA